MPPLPRSGMLRPTVPQVRLLLTSGKGIGMPFDLGRFRHRLVWSLVAITLLISASAPVGAQTQEGVSFLYVQTAGSGTLAGWADGAYTLTLHEVGQATTYFSDRPVRTGGHIPTQLFIDSWGKGEDNFATDPPNAGLTFLDPGRADEVLTLELSGPTYDSTARTLSYTARPLGSGGPLPRGLVGRTGPVQVPEAFGAAALFIDSRGYHCYCEATGDGDGGPYWVGDKSASSGWTVCLWNNGGKWLFTVNSSDTIVNGTDGWENYIGQNCHDAGTNCQ